MAMYTIYNYSTKTLSYIFVDRFLCGLYNEVSKGLDPFVR